MTDRELLELAAKAAGLVGYEYSYRDDGEPGYMAFDEGSPRTSEYWSPLTDDGDALRLAIKLRINIYFGYRGEGPIDCGRHNEHCAREWGVDDPANTRRAIVRAAAEIGKAMP